MGYKKEMPYFYIPPLKYRGNENTDSASGWVSNNIPASIGESENHPPKTISKRLKCHFSIQCIYNIPCLSFFFFFFSSLLFVPSSLWDPLFGPASILTPTHPLSSGLSDSMSSVSALFLYLISTFNHQSRRICFKNLSNCLK